MTSDIYRVTDAVNINGVPGEVQTDASCPYWEDAPDIDDEDAVSTYEAEWERRLLGQVETKLARPVLEILAFEPVDNW